MATDFAPYANLRMLWSKPGAITSLRDGLSAPAAMVVIEMFVKGDGPKPQELPSLRVGSTILQGYLTRWATLPAGADWLSAGTSWAWDTTGLMPAGLAAEARGHAYLGDLTLLPTRATGGIRGDATIMQLGGQFGVGGIGAELREALGDAIRVSFAAVQ